MKAFGVWLWEGWDQGADAQMLRKAAVELGPAWPIASTEQTAYEASIAKAKQDPERTELVQALGRVWPTYRTASGAEAAQSGWVGLGSRLLDYLSNIGVWGIALGGLLLILLFVWSFNPSFLDRMSRIDAARGLITFLFAVGTVGISVIIVLAAFLGNGPKEELAERFQRGKDVLTILIGVFGAILGFYFGTENRLQNAGQEQGTVAGRADAGRPPASVPGESQDGAPAGPAR